jgi:hypothetical protein
LSVAADATLTIEPITLAASAETIRLSLLLVVVNEVARVGIIIATAIAIAITSFLFVNAPVLIKNKYFS